MNNISIVGRLGRDAERRVTTNGKAVLQFTVADDVGFGDKKSTNWWRCSLWGAQAESKLIDYLVKGAQVVVFGEAAVSEFTDKDGAKRTSTDIRVANIQLVGGKGDKPGESAAPRQSAPTQSSGGFDDMNDSIPF